MVLFRGVRWGRVSVQTPLPSPVDTCNSGQPVKVLINYTILVLFQLLNSTPGLQRYTPRLQSMNPTLILYYALPSCGQETLISLCGCMGWRWVHVSYCRICRALTLFFFSVQSRKPDMFLHVFCLFMLRPIFKQFRPQSNINTWHSNCSV